MVADLACFIKQYVEKDPECDVDIVRNKWADEFEKRRKEFILVHLRIGWSRDPKLKEYIHSKGELCTGSKAEYDNVVDSAQSEWNNKERWVCLLE
jgi:hypothetical protein